MYIFDLLIYKSRLYFQIITAMNNFEQSFATGFNIIQTPIPPNFIWAIAQHNANPYPISRQARYLDMENEVYNMFFSSSDQGEDKYVSLMAHGGGWVNWHLCRYQGNLYFIFVSIDGTSYSARRTDRREIDELTCQNNQSSAPFNSPVGFVNNLDCLESTESSRYSTPIRAKELNRSDYFLVHLVMRS